MPRMLIGLLLVSLLTTPALAQEKKKIVFIAGRPSHGFAQHEHAAGCELLAGWINKSVPQLEAVVVKDGWPKDDSILDGAAAIVMFADGGNGHMVLPKLQRVKEL